MALSTYAGNKLLDAICRNISFQASPYASLRMSCLETDTVRARR